MYRVLLDHAVLDELEILPRDALIALSEVVALMEVAPWSGEAYNRMRPEAAMRTLAFGGAGLAIYLVVEDQRVVSLLRVLWAGPDSGSF